jgi:hypothetical protein
MLVAAMMAAFCGCAASGRSQVRALYSAEVACPRSQLQVVEIGSDNYVVEGCGFRQVYACLAQYGRDAVCQPNGPRRSLSGDPLPPPGAAQGPSPVAPVMAPVTAPGWTPGARVTVQAADGSKFNAVVDQVIGEQVSVTMPNGLHQWVPKASVTPQP